LLKVLVGNAQAIDVAATSAELSGFTSLRTSLGELRAGEVDLILPAASYPYVRIDSEYAVRRKAWQRVVRSGPRMLETWN
jgi:hypothetical protein